MKSLWLGTAVAIAVAASAAASAQSTKTVWIGVYTTAQATRGEAIYYAVCVDCHGSDLEGRERAPALAGGTFAQRSDGATLKKLFERVEEMPPDDPAGRLAAKDSIDVLAFLLRANNIPAGSQALVPDKDALAAITYTSQRPKF